MEKKIKAGILGATGLVGQEFVRMLTDHPFFDVDFLSASGDSAGKTYGEVVNWRIEEPVPERFLNMVVIDTRVEVIRRTEAEIIFSALPSSIASKVEDELRREGRFIFSNSSAFRMDPLVPILVPEVNPEHLELAKIQLKKYGGFIVTNPNCATSGLVLALRPISDEFGLKAVTVSTYQSISGAGLKGLQAMEIVGNVIPYISGEEEKIKRETQKLLGKFLYNKVVPASICVVASCCRIPVVKGHLESITIELERNADLETVEEVMTSFKGVPQKLNLPTSPERPVILCKEKDRPQPLLDVFSGTPERAKGMAVSIGRLRKSGKSGKTLSFFLLVNNTVRGAAGGSILNAELALAEGLIGSCGGGYA